MRRLKKPKILINLLIILFIANNMSYVSAKQEDETDELPKIGNFALPTSQQPGPLFSFGQNIVDKGDLLLINLASHWHAKGGQKELLTTGILYGLADWLCLLISIPSRNNQSNRLGNLTGAWWGQDLSIITEATIYQNTGNDSQRQITILGGLELPSSSGSNFHKSTLKDQDQRIILGATGGYTSTDWYMFGCLVTELSANIKKSTLGHQFFYEGGIAYNFNKCSNFILLGMVELNGIFWKTPFQEKKALNNILLFCPSLFTSWKHLIIQAGIQVPIFQKFVNRNDLLSMNATLSIAWTF